MATGDLDRIFAALGRAKVRYLVVGGVAVVLHGHLRLTADLDLALALDAPNVRAALKALSSLGYKPRAPVKAEDLADPKARRTWAREKNMQVFTLWSPKFPATEVDIFVEEPFPFDEAFSRAVRANLGNVEVPLASIPDVVEMKRRAGRPRDKEDVEALLALEGKKS